MKYSVDFNKLVVLLTPTFLRQPRAVAFLRSVVAPITALHYEFTQRRNDDHYKLDHNWQVCYLEKVLNDRFDVSARRIRVIEGDRYERQYIYTNAEQKPKYLGSIYLRLSSDYSDDGFDFTIDMAGVRADEYDVTAQVNFYKLEGTRYNIINLG